MILFMVQLINVVTVATTTTIMISRVTMHETNQIQHRTLYKEQNLLTKNGLTWYTGEPCFRLDKKRSWSLLYKEIFFERWKITLKRCKDMHGHQHSHISNYGREECILYMIQINQSTEIWWHKKLNKVIKQFTTNQIQISVFSEIDI